MSDSSKHDIKFKEVEEDLKNGIQNVKDSQNKKKIVQNR
jgi:hypothetical protein